MAGRRYDTEELQRIATLRNRGLSIQAVARELGRTPSGIQSALRARGWIDPARSKVMSSVSIFSPEQRDAFREFVRSRATHYTPTDIRNAWNKEATANQRPNVNNERVLYYLRESGLKKTKGEYMLTESYRRRQSAAQKTRRAKEQAACLRLLRVRRAEMYALESDLQRRQCHLCRETSRLAGSVITTSMARRKKGESSAGMHTIAT
jgi:IS30 family transposase